MATAQQTASQSLRIAQEKSRALPLPVFFYLIMVVTPFQFHLGPVLLNGVRAFLLIMIVPLTVNLLKGKYGRLIAADFLFFLHMAWAAIALSMNNPDRTIQFIGSNAVEFLGGYILARAYIRSSEVLMAVWKMLFAIVILSLPLAVFEAVTARPILIELINKLPSIHSVLNVPMEARMGLDRAQVMFSHPIHYGLFCSVTFALCFVGMKAEWGNFRRYLTTALMCAGVFLSLSSGALLPVFLQIGLIIWAAIFRKLNARWVLLISLIVLCYIVIDLLSNRSPIRVFMSYATFSAHNAYWRGLIFEYGMQNVIDNPIFGIGLNDWVRPAWMYTNTVDNFWLLLAMQFGIPGLILAVLGYTEVLLRIGLRRLDPKTTIWRLRRAYMFSFVGLTFTLSTVHIWTNIYSWVFFMLGSGVWMIFADTNSQSDRDAGAVETERGNVNLRRTGGHDVVLARSHGAPSNRAGPNEAKDKPNEAPEPKNPYTRFPKSAGNNDSLP
ncbi:O-antigen ligase family protein [uncultured Aliiroseovarius sp.]|uniref:O-antigen ligase family protein n=1 Tax=uncultured Aliiroseovarius sp. TaxID=1658783 RepID=UPI002594A406|nr:O-antigen ligase family protein [uncultured Aliiroseovarius sp.]